jgi:hypothetical protein
MIRKTILGLVAASAIAAAFAPTAASAHYYGGYGYRSYGYTYKCYDCYRPSYNYSYGYRSYGGY